MTVRYLSLLLLSYLIAACSTVTSPQLPEHSAWSDQIRTKIQGHVRIPPGTPANAIVSFSVYQTPTGEIAKVVRTRSSDFPAYDEAMEQAILKSSPFSKAPTPNVFLPRIDLTFRPDIIEYNTEIPQKVIRLPERPRSEVYAVFQANKRTLHSIYKQALVKHPGITGRVVVRMTVLPSGKVSSVDIESSDTTYPEFDAEIIKAVALFDFGQNDVATMRFTYPLWFVPSE